MSAAFTPGPWDCTGCLFPDDDMGGIYFRIQAEGIVAGAANAKLIAASPDLYEALEYARESLGNPVPVGRRHVARKIDAALARARGEPL